MPKNSLIVNEKNPSKKRSIGIWDKIKNIVIIKKQRGKSLFYVGRHGLARTLNNNNVVISNDKSLYPEEAITLLEKGQLDIYLTTQDMENLDQQPLSYKEFSQMIFNDIKDIKLTAYIDSYRSLKRRKYKKIERCNYFFPTSHIVCCYDVSMVLNKHDNSNKSIINHIFVCQSNNTSITYQDIFLCAHLNDNKEHKIIGNKLLVLQNDGNSLLFDIN